ncbi:MAG: pepsin-like aspartyl protease, partial [Flammeovirgaceae bacterium]
MQWADQASNEAYWSVNSKNIEFGKSKSLVDYNQKLILDNGMSLAMAPEPSFVRLITSLNNDYGVGCEAMRPVWGCSCTKESYSKLPSISFNVIANPEGKTFFVEMPKEAY